MLNSIHNLPSKINPVFLDFGFFSVYWYSMMYLIGFLAVTGLLYYRIKKKEAGYKWGDVFDFILYSFLGGILGGRVGYVIFYNLAYFLNNPIDIFLPLNKGGHFSGIYGMSFHGGILGIFLVAFVFCKKRKINLWQIFDFVLPAVPAGYFFGRIGNFINGELYGRETIMNWGMDFGDGVLRHPSQLYEAFGEGIILFLILWSLRNKFAKKVGMISGLYVFGYGVIRFIIEFWRQPDNQIGFVFWSLTMGQILSLIMVLVGIILILRTKREA